MRKKLCKYIYVLFVLFSACIFKNEQSKSNAFPSKQNKFSKQIKKENATNNNAKLVDIIRQDYTLKFPKNCNINNRPTDGSEFIIYGPRTSNKQKVKLSLRKMNLSNSLNESINFFLEEEKKLARQFKLINVMPDGYHYSKYKREETVIVYRKVKMKENTAYIFTFEAEKLDFEKYKKMALSVFKSLKFRYN